MRHSKILLEIGVYILAAFLIVYSFTCNKNPSEPEPTPDPCLECPPVFIEVPGDTVFVVGDSVFVLCKKVDATAEFTVTKDQSVPNDYRIVAEGYPDELISIIDIAPAPVDTSFTRVFPNYTGGRISIEKVAGSRAAAIGVAIIALECSETNDN